MGKGIGNVLMDIPTIVDIYIYITSTWEMKGDEGR